MGIAHPEAGAFQQTDLGTPFDLAHEQRTSRMPARLEGSKQKFENTFDDELQEELDDCGGDHVDQTKFRPCFWIAQKEAVHAYLSLLLDTLPWYGKFRQGQRTGERRASEKVTDPSCDKGSVPNTASAHPSPRSGGSVVGHSNIHAGGAS